MYKKILVPIDGSEPANLGLNEAIQLAKDQGGAIRLVHIVNELILLSSDAYGANAASVLETLRKNGESILGEAEAAVRRAGVDVDAVLFEAMGGQAGAQIVQQANAWPADLIVCGTHGRRGIRRMVLGSDAEYILRHTPVPVLLVRSREPTPRVVLRASRFDADSDCLRVRNPACEEVTAPKVASAETENIPDREHLETWDA